jgi:hypothetical protein
MAAIVNDRDVLLQAAGVRLETVTLPDNVIIPALKAIRLAAPSLTFQVTTAGVASPSSILLTASLVQVTGAISFSVLAGTGTLTSVTGTTATLLYANMVTDSITIRAQVTEAGITYTADLTIAKVRDGVAGAGARNAYLVQSQSAATPGVSPNPTTGTSSVPTGWSSSYTQPGAGQSAWGIDGTYDATANQISWSAPFLVQGFAATIQSDNFISGATGWRLKRDTGDLEANNGTFRGDVTTTGVGKFNGSTSSSSGTAAIVGNDSLGRAWGIIGYAGGVVSGSGPALGAGAGVLGVAQGDGNAGVEGLATFASPGVYGTTSAPLVGGVYANNSSGGPAIQIGGAGSFLWHTCSIAEPAFVTYKFLRNDGTWASLASAVVYVSSGGAPAGSVLGSLVIDTYSPIGQVRIPYYAV